MDIQMFNAEIVDEDTAKQQECLVEVERVLNK
jgi:hypothetical protein